MIFGSVRLSLFILETLSIQPLLSKGKRYKDIGINTKMTLEFSIYEVTTSINFNKNIIQVPKNRTNYLTNQPRDYLNGNWDRSHSLRLSHLTVQSAAKLYKQL